MGNVFCLRIFLSYSENIYSYNVINKTPTIIEMALYKSFLFFQLESYATQSMDSEIKFTTIRLQNICARTGVALFQNVGTILGKS